VGLESLERRRTVDPRRTRGEQSEHEKGAISEFHRSRNPKERGSLTPQTRDMRNHDNNHDRWSHKTRGKRLEFR
jgi:hypothetical protein